MSVNLSDETRAKITALLNEISVAHNLDGEIREELAGHIEDKLIAYLEGEVKLSEDDAFVLVREHFGNPAVIRELYRDVEAVWPKPGFMRRIGAMATASLGAGIVYSSIIILLLVFLRMFHHEGVIIGTHRVSFLIKLFFTGAMAISTILFWMIALDWKRKSDSGDTTWFIRMKPSGIALVFLCSAALYAIGTVANILLYSRLILHFSGFTFENNHLNIIQLLQCVQPMSIIINGTGGMFASTLALYKYIFITGMVLQVLGWLWFIEETPPRLRTIAAGCIAWFVFIFLQMLQIPMIVGFKPGAGHIALFFRYPDFQLLHILFLVHALILPWLICFVTFITYVIARTVLSFYNHKDSFIFVHTRG